MANTNRLVYRFITEDERTYTLTIRNVNPDTDYETAKNVADYALAHNVFDPNFVSGGINRVRDIRHVKTTVKDFEIA